MTASIHHHADAAPAAAHQPRPAEGPAFAELYERYFPELYDFVVRTMGETERASDVVTSAFVQTLMGFRQRRTSAPVDAILFSTARDIALDKLRTSSGTADPAVQSFLQERLTAVDQDRASAPAVAPDRELAELVWRLLAAHAADEYSLIDLIVRRGISAESAALASGRPAEEVRASITSLLSNVEDWITTAILIHRGSQECPELNAELDRAGPDAPSAQLRAAVQQHVVGCTSCPQFRDRYPTAAQTLAALAPVPPPDGMREAVWLDISAALGSHRVEDAPASARTERVFAVIEAPIQWWSGAALKGRLIAAGAAAFAIGVFIAAAILLAPSDGIGIEDPQGFASATHDLGQPSDQNVVGITWEQHPEAMAYSVEWSQAADTLPDDVPDLPGDATGTKSPALDEGEWYFHLRTQGPEGQWTRTVHLGPFIIVAALDDDPDGGAGATATPNPSPRATGTPAPTPQPTPTPAPQPEPTSVFVPDPEPDPAPEPEPFDPGPPAPTPAIVEGPCPATVPLPGAANPTDAMGPVQTVLQYYLLINEGRYGEAYDLFTLDLQAAFAPFSEWAGGFATTTLVSPLVAVLVEQGVDYAVVYVEVLAVDIDPVQGNLQYLFQGTWVLTTIGGPWELAAANIDVSLC